MASTYQGRVLTEQHRVAQTGLRARFLQAFQPYWTILDWNRVDDTAAAWVRATKDLIRQWRQRSADLSEDYYRQFRNVEVPGTDIPMPVIEFQPRDDRPIVGQDQRSSLGQSGQRGVGRSDRAIVVRGHTYTKDENGLVKPRIDWDEFDKAVEKSLLVTGPSEIKRRTARHEPEPVAMRNSFVAAAGAASRHVLTGGRETQLTLVEADEVALGWARVTDGDPCSFCAVLASRGPAYKTKASAGFSAHDNCACTAEAVFARTADWPGAAREYQRLWYASTKGYSGKDALNAFRRAYERQQREARRAAA